MEATGKRYIVHPSRSDEFTLWNVADIHYGNRACAMNRLREDIRRIADDDNSFWVCTGDYAEFISPADPRFDPAAVSEEVKVRDLGRLGRCLVERIAELFKPIAHKCLGIGLGNHEARYMKVREQQDLHGWLCQHLRVANLEYTALTDMMFVRKPNSKHSALVGTPTGRYPDLAQRGYQSTRVRLFTSHGAGYAATPGGKLNRLIQYMHIFDADIYLIGHLHDQKAQRLVRIGADGACDDIVEMVSVGAMSGSYLKCYARGVTTYGEQRGYQPTPLGASFVKIRPETREFRAEV